MVNPGGDIKRIDSTKQSLIGGAMVLTIAMIVVKIVGMIYAIPLKAVLDKSGVGIYAQAHGLYEIIYSLALAGFPSAISKIIVDLQRQGRYTDIKRTVRVANMFFLLLGLSGALILALTARFYAETVMKNPNITISVLVVAPSIIFSCLMGTHRGYYQGMLNMRPTAISQVVESVSKCIIGLTASYFVKAHFTDEFLKFGTVLGNRYRDYVTANVQILSLSSAGAMLGVTLSIFVGWIFLLIYRRVKGAGITEEQYTSSPDAYTDRYLLKQILTIGMPITFAVVATQITGFVGNAVVQTRLIASLSKDIDAVFTSHNGWLEYMDIKKSDPLGKIATDLFGCYSFGDSFFFLAPSLVEPFKMSAFPHIAESWLRKDLEDTKRHINTTLKLTLLISAPLGFGISALATPIMHLVYARRNAAEVAVGGPLLSVLAAASVFLAVYAASNTILNAIGRHDIPVKLLVAGGVLNLLVTYILVGIPSINIKGSPVGNVSGYILIAVLSLLCVYRNTGVKINIRDSLIKPLLCGAICAAAAYTIYFLQMTFLFHVIRQRIATIVSIISGGLIYLVIAAVFRIVSRDEIDSIIKNKKIGAMLAKLRIVR